MLQANLDTTLIPVVHGHSFRKIINYSKKILEIYKDYTNSYPKWIGLGSMVPLLKYSKGSKNIPTHSKDKRLNAPMFVFAATALVKKLFPKSKLHVFGIGGTTTMNLIYGAGADSVDSVGWRLKAAHGAIQLPGLSDRFLFPRKNKSRKVLEEEHEEEFLKCECGVNPHTRENLDKSFNLRALHNAYVYLNEFERIKNMLPFTSDKLEQLKTYLKTSPLRKYIPFIIELNNGYFKNYNLSDIIQDYYLENEDINKIN